MLNKLKQIILCLDKDFQFSNREKLAERDHTAPILPTTLSAVEGSSNGCHIRYITGMAVYRGRGCVCVWRACYL